MALLVSLLSLTIFWSSCLGSPLPRNYVHDNITVSDDEINEYLGRKTHELWDHQKKLGLKVDHTLGAYPMGDINPYGHYPHYVVKQAVEDKKLKLKGD